MIDVSSLVTEPAYAGGLFIHQMEQRDVPTIGGMIQNQLVFSLELDYANMLVGIETNDVVELLEVFPNPVSDVIRLRYLIHDSRYMICDLLDDSGKLIRRLSEESHSGMNELEIDVSDLPAGTYFMRMQVGNNIVTKKVIIAK